MTSLRDAAKVTERSQRMKAACDADFTTRRGSERATRTAHRSQSRQGPVQSRPPRKCGFPIPTIPKAPAS